MLYGDVKQINYFTVLNRMTIDEQLQVWSWVLNAPAELGRAITSPFRLDHKPNCTLREYQGRVLFSDFADTRRCKYTCIHAVADLYSIGLNQAAQRIYTSFLFNKPLVAQTKTVTGSKKLGRPGKDMWFIPFTYNGEPCFLKSGADYWKQRYAHKHELQNCYQVSHFYLDNQLVKPKQPCFALTCESRFKLYQPYNPKQKWLSNTNKDDKWVFEQFSDTTVITSSYKDCLPWYRYTSYNVHAFQNEGVLPKDNDYTQYSRIIINFDSDRAGVLAAYKLLEHLKYKYAQLYFFPTALGKDSDEVLVNIGEKNFKKLIKNV